MIGHPINIPIEELSPNPLQPRGLITPESLVDLVDSIRQHGVLEPLVVAETPAGYQIIAGERRWRAAKLAGLTSLPAVIKRTTTRGMLEMAIVENVQRTDLNPLERALAFQKLIDEFNLTTSEISQRIGKSHPYVCNTLRLITLPDALKDALLAGDVSEGHIRALAAIDEPTHMIKALTQILREKGSVRRAEALAREYKQRIKKVKREPSSWILSEKLDQIMQDLKKTIQASSVRVTQSNREARVVLSFKGDTDQTGPLIDRIYRALKVAFSA